MLPILINPQYLKPTSMENVQLWQLCRMNSALWSVNVGSVFKQQAKQYSFLSGDENTF